MRSWPIDGTPSPIPFDRHLSAPHTQGPQVDHLAPARARMERVEKYWRKNSYYLKLTVDRAGRLLFIEEGSGRPIAHPVGIFLELIFLATRARLSLDPAQTSPGRIA